MLCGIVKKVRCQATINVCGSFDLIIGAVAIAIYVAIVRCGIIIGCISAFNLLDVVRYLIVVEIQCRSWCFLK